jgi:hypothetical protein
MDDKRDDGRILPFTHALWSGQKRSIYNGFLVSTLMKLFLFCVALFAGQLQTSQNEAVVRLPPHVLAIPIADGGKMVELLYAAPSLSLPKQVPSADAEGKAWYVDVRNLGPGEVALEGVEGFVVHLQPKQVVRIRAAGNTYTATKP